MTNSKVHKTACVSSRAHLGQNTEVGPFAIIEDNVKIGNNCRISGHVVIKKDSILGNNVFVDNFAVIGGNPQSIGFSSETPSNVIIGDYTQIRENVTIHRATQPNTSTKIGNHCFLMATSHVGHDSILGDNVILVNGCLVAGCVEVGDYCNFSGNTLIHQKVKIGEGVLIAGRGGTTLDLPPFLLISERHQVHGLNLIGLKRRGYTLSTIDNLKACYKAVLGSPGDPYKKAKEARESGLDITDLGKKFLDFFKIKSSKGCVQWKQTQFAH